MERRSFLGLFGCGLIALATDWTGALKGLTSAPVLTGRGWADTLQVFPYTDDPNDNTVLCYSLERIGSTNGPLISMPLHARGTFVWQSPMGLEIVVPEGQGLDVYARRMGDTTRLPVLAQNWSIAWRADRLASVTGCEYCGTAYFAWPAGGNCNRCGGRLPAPLQNPSGRYVTVVTDGVRRIYSIEALHPVDDAACDYCGVQMVDGACLYGCGGASSDTARA